MELSLETFVYIVCTLFLLLVITLTVFTQLNVDPGHLTVQTMRLIKERVSTKKWKKQTESRGPGRKAKRSQRRRERQAQGRFMTGALQFQGLAQASELSVHHTGKNHTSRREAKPHSQLGNIKGKESDLSPTVSQ